MKTLKLVLIAALGLTGSVVAAQPAQAAQCASFASYGISVCGSWNAVEEVNGGILYAKTSSFSWTVSKSDNQIAITSVKVRMGGMSRCSASPGWSGCVEFNNVQLLSRATSGTVKSVPSWAGKWGLVQGTANYQRSNVDITWCRAGTCHTETTPFSLGDGATS